MAVWPPKFLERGRSANVLLCWVAGVKSERRCAWNPTAEAFGVDEQLPIIALWEPAFFLPQFSQNKISVPLESLRQEAKAFSDFENERPRERLRKQNTTKTISSNYYVIKNFPVYLKPLFPARCQPIEVAVVANKLIRDGTFEKDTAFGVDLNAPL